MMRSALQKSGAVASAAMRKSPLQATIGSTRTMAKEIRFGVEGRAAMLRGVDTLADAVQVSEKHWLRITLFPCWWMMWKETNRLFVWFLLVFFLCLFLNPCCYDNA